MKPLYYTLTPVYEQTSTMSADTGMVFCLATQTPLAASGGPVQALDPDVVELLSKGLLLHAKPLLDGREANVQCLDQIIRLASGECTQEGLAVIKALAETALAVNVVDAC